MSKEICVLFVGDRPSSKNTDQSVAFVGTRSGITLERWAGVIGIGDYRAINAYKIDGSIDSVGIEHARDFYFVIALGNNASRALTKAGIEHHKLPHPSGMNRILNDKDLINKMLQDCKEAIDAYIVKA